MANSYTIGTLSVTNGSVTVNGTGTAFLINNVAGALIQIDGDTRSYEVATVVSNTQFTLDKAYAGATGAGKTYRMWLTPAAAASAITINQQLGIIISRLVDSAPEIQNFLDADTVAEALAAIGAANAAALNASSLTGTVPDARLQVGSRAGSEVVTDFNVLINAFRVFGAASATGYPVGDALSWVESIVQDNGANKFGYQIAHGYVDPFTHRYVRKISASLTWGAWEEAVPLALSTLNTKNDARYARKPQTAAGNGQWVALNTGSGAVAVLPSGGTWAWFLALTSTAGAWTDDAFSGIGAGGATIGSAFAGYKWKGFAWRISE